MHFTGTSPTSRGSRAFGLGSRRGAWLGACSAVVVAIATLLVVVASGGRSSSSAVAHRAEPVGTPHASVAKYGGLPAWLPKEKASVGRVLHASRAHPALSIQGEAISVDLGHGGVLATAAGPSVPEQGRTPVPETSPCTFVVTFARATGVIPIAPSEFTFVDAHGDVRRPHVTGMTGGAAPRRVLPGQTVSLALKGILPTGDGALTWAPGGARPTASWDFVVEID